MKWVARWKTSSEACRRWSATERKPEKKTGDIPGFLCLNYCSEDAPDSSSGLTPSDVQDMTGRHTKKFGRNLAIEQRFQEATQKKKEEVKLEAARAEALQEDIVCYTKAT